MGNPRARRRFTGCIQGLLIQTPSQSKSMRAILTLTVLVLGLSLTEAITFGGASRSKSIKAAAAHAAAGDWVFWFTPAVAMVGTDTIIFASDQDIWTANAAVLTCTVHQDGSSVAVTAADTKKSQPTDLKDLTITLNGAVAKDKVVTVQCAADAKMANNVANDVSVGFQVKTSKESTYTTKKTAFTPKTADAMLNLAVTRVNTKNGVDGGKLKITFDPQVAPTNSQTIKFTFSNGQSKIFKDDETDNAKSKCTVAQDNTGIHGYTAAFKDSTWVVADTGLSLQITVVTAGAGILPGRRVVVECPENLLTPNEADKSSGKVAVEGTGAGAAITATSTGMYATGKAVTWTSATRAVLTWNTAPGNLVVKFTPTTIVPVDGKVTLVASAGIFTAALAHGATNAQTATATTDGTTTTAVPECVTSASDALAPTVVDTVICTVKGTALAATKPVVLTISNNMVNNPASAHTVTFTCSTSADVGYEAAQAGYTTVAPPASASANTNTTGGSASAAASGTDTTVTQVYTFADLTFGAYTGKMKSNCECAYANTVEAATTPTWCVATTSAYTYKNGVVTTSSAAARRAAKVTFVLKVKSSIKSSAQLTTMVAAGSTAAKFAIALTAVNAASNYTAAPGTATVAAATITGSSSASTLLPSMLSLVVAIFVAARQ